MIRLFSACLGAAVSLYAAGLSGLITDNSGAPVTGARVQLTRQAGLSRQARSDTQGRFSFDEPSGRLTVSAPGFARWEREVSDGDSLDIRLELAPVTDAITVSASTIPAALTEQATSITIIDRDEIGRRNEASALDLLRQVPGVAVTQTGQRGGATSMFIRGGDSKYGLVLIDGIPVNDMRFGGFFDFAHIPTDYLDRIEVIRGPQSAVYGSYANAGVINFVTRLDESAPQFNVLAEGGTFRTRRFAVGASGAALGFRATATASQLNTEGEVPNDDYRNQNVSLGIGRRFRRQDFSARGSFNSSENGVPGPWGSNPVGNFFGLDPVSRNWNNFSAYQFHYDAEATPRLRAELLATYFQNNNSYISAFGSTFNKDLRGLADGRLTAVISPSYIVAAGYAWSREEVKNTYITDNSGREFPLRRDQQGIYIENRFQVKRRFFLNAGVRTEIIQTPFIPGNGFSGRPDFAADTIVRPNPKIGAAWQVTPTTRLHSSFGTGIRPPGGFDLAFTSNPVLKPELAISYDAGVEQRVGSRISLDATWFDNRYSDLIVSLGGSLSRLGKYSSDNLANSSVHGAEFIANLRPSRWITVNGSYTWLKSRINALDGTSSLAPQYYRVGQALPRRPPHSGSVNSTFAWRRMTWTAAAYFRGKTLDTEPNFGAFSGFFDNPGFARLDLGVNYELGGGLTLYGSLRNALNQRYEEIYGYPSPRLNFIAGLKWRISRER